MSPELITAILGAGGIMAILPKLIDGVAAWRTGRAAEEKQHNQSLVQRMATAEARAEIEAAMRRDWQEYAGRLRVLLIELGVLSADLPPRPDRDDTKLF